MDIGLYSGEADIGGPEVREPVRQEIRSMKILGFLQLFDGLVSIPFGGVSLMFDTTLAHCAVGIWAGVLYLIHGTTAVVFAKKGTVKLMVSQLVDAIIVSVVALFHFGVAGYTVHSVTLQAERHAVDLLHKELYPSVANARYHRANKSHYLSLWEPEGTMDIYNKENQVHGIVAVYAVQMLVALLAFSCSIWGALYTCCGSKHWCLPNTLNQQLTYSSLSARIAGVGQYVVGVLLLLFLVARYLVRIDNYGEYLWMTICVTMFIVSGLFGYVSGIQKTKAWIITSMVLSIVSGVFVLAGFCFVIVFYIDRSVSCHNRDDGGDYYYTYHPCNLYAEQAGIDTVMLLLILAQACFLIWSSALACKTCCCKPVSEGQNQTYGTVLFTNQAAQQPTAYILQEGQLVPAQLITLPAMQSPSGSGAPLLVASHGVCLEGGATAALPPNIDPQMSEKAREALLPPPYEEKEGQGETGE
eukprot:GHVU01009550.1.p1 GENE.GHVU01009550.1~~GHVU01009550.1.p1  ORF type:complete len:471 (+),score=20.30 GHVU01009550.1:84-1496(+)